MKQMRCLTAVVVSLSLMGPGGFAKTVDNKNKKKTTAPAASKVQAATNKSLTVGAMLKRADRGGGLSSATADKKQTQLPTFSNSLFDATQSSGPTVNLAQVKPPRSSTFFQSNNDDKAKLERITDEQIQELFKLTQKFKSSPNRGELWLRLAELYVEKAGFIDHRKQNEYDQKLKEHHDGKRAVKPALDLRDAREYNRKAIQLYEWFARDFPKDSKMDQALFFLGYNFYELGDTKRGTQYYTRLTKEFPRSPYITESNFALGEFYFENEKWNDALKYYLQVTKHPRNRLAVFAQYKVAWCHFRGGDAKKALLAMEQLIRSSRSGAGGSSSDKKQVSKVKLEAEGLRDITLFYSDVGNPEKAPAYFEALVGNDHVTYLEKLAYFYSDTGNREGGRFLFNYLIQQNPSAGKAFDYKYQIVKSYSTANKTREFREELYSWIRDFGLGSAWYQANKSKPEVIANSEKLREQTLRTWVLQQHQTAQNSRAPFSQSLANEGYKLYMAEFPQSAVIADMHFYYAELLYDMNKYDEAGMQYRWVVDNGAGTKFYGKSSENIVLALERNIPKDQEIAERVGKSVDPVQIDPKVDRFVQAGIWYSAKFPQAQKTPEIRFRIGRLYYQHNQFDQAVPYFKEIIQKHPNTKYAEYSANLLLDIYNLKKDYAGLEKTGGELLAIPAIAGSAAGQDIRAVLERSNFKKAQDQEVGKDYAGSAQSYEAFAKANPKSELAGAAMFNAAINFERAGQPAKAMAAHTAVLAATDKKSEPLKPKSRRIVAKLYQDSGKLEDASKAFRDAGVEAGTDPLAPNLFFNAAVLDEALGRNQAAAQNYQLYYDKSKSKDRSEALYSIATLHRRGGRTSQAIDKYKEYVQSSGQTSQEHIVESAFLVYSLGRKLGRQSESEEWKRRTLSLQSKFAPQKKGVGASYAAKIRLSDADVTFRDFNSVKLNNLAKLKALSDQKISHLTKLNQQLGEIIKYDSPEEIVGALALLGKSNYNMGYSFVTAPIPPELKKPEEIEQYKAGVKKIAEPFFAKAKDALKAAVDRAQEFEIYSDDYLQAREQLALIDPTLAPYGLEEPIDIRQPNWMGL
jgi:TolA-binding protein